MSDTRITDAEIAKFDDSFYRAMFAAEAAGKKHPVISAAGTVIGTSRNLAGIRTMVRRRPVKYIEISPAYGGFKKDSEAILRVMFQDGSRFETRFASFTVLRGFVKNWRSVHGVQLLVQGRKEGEVSTKNPALDY